MWAVIGGSGFEQFANVENRGAVDRETPFGLASSGMRRICVTLSDEAKAEILFLPRHGEQHELSPSEVNYAANIFALKRAGATKIIAFSAVGSLREELRPGDMVIPQQFIDRTRSLRRNSFCGDGIVGHVSLAEPIWAEAAHWVREHKPEFSFSIHFEKTALVIEGPQFSTRAESHSYRAMGADTIGMTAYPEFALAREAGLAYLPCCFVTDYDSWNESIPHVTLAQVLELMRQNNGKAFELLQKLLWATPGAAVGGPPNADVAPELMQSALAHNGGLRAGLMTPIERVPAKHRAWLDILLQ